jgi:hypothetical protein
MMLCYADWHNALWRNVRREKTGAPASLRPETGQGSIRCRVFVTVGAEARRPSAYFSTSMCTSSPSSHLTADGVKTTLTVCPLSTST